MSSDVPTGKDAIAAPVGVRADLTPLGFHHYSEQFLEAARTVRKYPGFSPVRYYLYCHSIELVLKAYLLAKGVSVTDLRSKSLGHNLEGVVSRANKAGLASVASVTADEWVALLRANAYYQKKGFEYFQIKQVVRTMSHTHTLPDLGVLDSLAERLGQLIRAICIEA
ncbi:MAG: hypothetical protein LAO05_10780 [Acidobacteriia bacterium]|nr:hypothetical protein [Terriglobia bacterium]